MDDYQNEAMPVGAAEVAAATQTLQRYKAGKAALDRRLVDNELWFRMGHWKNYQNPMMPGKAQPSSGWLFNSIANKHADAMDNYPEPNVLPRAADDEATARALSSVLPVVLEQADYEQVYSDCWWRKLKQGTGVTGVFWDPAARGGVGDIAVRAMNLLMLYWEPGVADIQDSPDFFSLSLEDTAQLTARYPQLAGHTAGVLDVPRYIHEDGADTASRSVVVDWYYKRPDESGRMVLHYCKFCNGVVLYASENDPEYAEGGFYEDGEYPVVFDVLFPEKGTPAGFGYTAIAKDPQLYIDKLWGNILETSMMGSKRRYFASESLNINEEEFLDWRKPIIHVSGQIDESRLREVTTRPLDSIYANIVQMKIDEMKETSSNRDVSNGGTSSGATAAAAISALQEAGNKASRDMISACYRAQAKIVKLCIERMRQFYDAARTFRITNEMPYEYAQIGVNELGDQVTGVDSLGNDLFRRPVFDIKIKAQKKNPFSRAEQNERAKELYSLGFFSPDRAQESMIALDMMDFEGIDKIKSQVNEGATLYNVVQQQSDQLQKALAVIQQLTGQDMGIGMAGGTQSGGSTHKSGSSGGIERKNADAQSAQTPYMQKLAEQSKPNMDTGSSAAMPGV